jgi:hypothetical protein
MQTFLSFCKLTRIGRRMSWLTEANISCNNLFVTATCEHANSALSSTRIQSIGRGEKLG